MFGRSEASVVEPVCEGGRWGLTSRLSQVRGDRSGEREDEGKIESETRAVVDAKEALSGRK